MAQSLRCLTWRPEGLSLDSWHLSVTLVLGWGWRQVDVWTPPASQSRQSVGSRFRERSCLKYGVIVIGYQPLASTCTYTHVHVYTQAWTGRSHTHPRQALPLLLFPLWRRPCSIALAQGGLTLALPLFPSFPSARMKALYCHHVTLAF